ncbi:hypothetical protein [Acetobacter sp. DsW_063]|uniref:hypothetical protein n=1 Tax=Acetobacter sp. DsW_063 TaxID=1514894 RepID=UPI000A396052|nr:hypothetical protein [Acetobacter sp. DsW_063]
MSQSGQTPPQNRITDLKVSGHLMTLDQGLFCVFHAPAQQPPGASGLPGVRLTVGPLANDDVAIATFDSTGWLGGVNNGALVRVSRGPAQVLVTIYQDQNTVHEAPRLQVLRLSDAGVPASPVAARVEAAQPHASSIAAPTPIQTTPAPKGQAPEVAAHIQRRGDVSARLGEWMGKPGSRSWIEGFGISPDHTITPADIEYQAVLGKGWLSPWAQGGQYCGSRGMALPILGLKVRLKGEAAEAYSCLLEASFTDGTKIGPIDGAIAAEAESLAPLEAFRIAIAPRDDQDDVEIIDELEDELEEDLALLESATTAPSRAQTRQRPGRPQSETAKPARAVATSATRVAPPSSAKKKTITTTNAAAPMLTPKQPKTAPVKATVAVKTTKKSPPAQPATSAPRGRKPRR